MSYLDDLKVAYKETVRDLIEVRAMLEDTNDLECELYDLEDKLRAMGVDL